MADRVYHWKHGWIPLDHPEAPAGVNEHRQVFVSPKGEVIHTKAVVRVGSGTATHRIQDIYPERDMAVVVSTKPGHGHATRYVNLSNVRLAVPESQALLAKFSDAKLLATIEAFRTQPDSPSLRILLAEARKRGLSV